MPKLDKYHYHEILDRTSLVGGLFHENIEHHPAVQENKELKFEAERITKILYAFENMCAHFKDSE